MRSVSENDFRRQRLTTISCSLRILFWILCVFHLASISEGLASAPADFSLDAQGHIYVADPASRGGIIRYDDISGKNPLEIGITCSNRRCKIADPRSIFVDKNNRIFIADATGRIFVLDQHKRSWRSIASEGMVPLSIFVDAKDQLFASYDDNHVKASPGCEVKHTFQNPRGIFVDSLGQVYVADTGNHQIVRIHPQCEIERFGENGSGEKQLKEPAAVFVDEQKHIYIADTGNHRIVRTDDFSGRGWIALDGFQSPGKVLVDTQGRIDVLDSGNIVQVDPKTNLRTVLPLRKRNHEFSSPVDVSVDTEGKIYVADEADQRIVSVNNMSADGWTQWDGDQEEVPIRPVSVFAKGNHSVYVTDSESRQIIELDATLHVTRSISTEKFFVRPEALFVDQAGRIFLTDFYDHAIARLDDPSDPQKKEVYWGKDQRSFDQPSGIAVDAGGKIYIADTLNQRIVRMDDLQGTNWTELSFPRSGKRAVFPVDVALDSRKRLYVLDSSGRIIRFNHFSLDGWMEFGSEGFGIKHFYHPSAISLDSQDRIYVADTGNRRIIRIDDLSGQGWMALGATSPAQVQLFHPNQ